MELYYCNFDFVINTSSNTEIYTAFRASIVII